MQKSHCEAISDGFLHCNCESIEQLLNLVRKYTKDFELNEAVEQAVNECIHDNILSDFLRANKAEVISMSIFEYDKELEERKLRKAEYEAGVTDAKKQTALALASRNMSYAEISEILNVPVKSVLSWINSQK